MSYNSNSIQILEGLKPVKKTPGMYIGSTNIIGLHHLLWEIIDNSVDESLAGFCDEIKVIINKNSSITVADNGRGIPVGIHQKSLKSTVETIFTTLHAGGKFNSDSYKFSGGLHGVGSSVVNALSSSLDILIYKNNNIYSIKFKNGGEIEQNLKVIGQTEKTGTTITFMPEWKIFEENIDFDYSIIVNKLKQTSFLNKNLNISIIDNRQEKPKLINFLYKNGIKDYLAELLQEAENINNISNISNIIYFKNNWKDMESEISFQYLKTSENNIFSFCNNIFTKNGGTHLKSVKTAMFKAFQKYLNNNTKKNFKIIADDILEGLNLIVSIKHKNPLFQGQTKDSLENLDIYKNINNYFVNALYSFLLENPTNAKNIIDKLYITYRARIAAKNAREIVIRKSLTEGFSLPGKLSDCQSKDPTKSEIYIVEGDSAGGSAKLGRNREFQAILPLRGKIINSEKAIKHRIFNNNEIKTIITALGTNILSNFNIRNLRYNKIIIMTDADVDGSHIRILLLTFFYRYMKPLIDNQNIFIAQPPLYKTKIGNNIKYYFSDQELEVFKQENKNSKIEIQRYKGLGEMNPQQLWETTMNPKTRTLIQIKIEDTLKASQTISILMGNDIEARKQYIKDNAKFVKNIDV